MKLVVLLGAPGSGKGTQAEKLEQCYQLRHVSTGDMLRAEVKAGSEIGNEVAHLIEKGHFVSDEIVFRLLEKRLYSEKQKEPNLKGFTLDGFPRTTEQASYLDGFLKNLNSDLNLQLHKVLLFDVPFAVLVKRLSGRKTCSGCGMMFHDQFFAPKVAGFCDRCGASLQQRKDDHESVIKERIDTYQRLTKPVIEYYEAQSHIERIVNLGSAEEVFQEIKKALDHD
jgi:adenylate kinase